MAGRRTKAGRDASRRRWALSAVLVRFEVTTDPVEAGLCRDCVWELEDGDEDGLCRVCQSLGAAE